MIRRYLKLRDVAQRLGVSSRWLYRHRGRLTRDYGFPRPAVGLHYRWDEAAVAAWQDRMLSLGGAAAAARADLCGPAAIDWAVELDRRARDLSGGAI